MKIVRRLFVAAFIACTLVSPVLLAEPSKQTMTLEQPGQPPENLDELTPSRLVERLTKFLHGSADGVLTVVGSDESARLTKKGDRVEVVQNMNIQGAYNLVVVPPMHGLLAECRFNLRNLGVALESYHSDSDSQYPVGLPKLVPTYLAKLPRCPVSDTEYVYRKESLEGNFEYFVLRCRGDHTGLEVPSGFPRYNSVVGPVADEHEQELSDHQVKEALYRASKDSQKDL